MAQSSVSTPTNIFLNLQQFTKNSQTERSSAEKDLVEKYRNNKKYEEEFIRNTNEINAHKQYSPIVVPKMNFFKKSLPLHE